MDKKVRPQDDFYSYANGGWLKRSKIPPQESRWGSFTILRYKTEHQLKKLIGENLKIKKSPSGSNTQLVADMFRSASDMKRRNVLGIRPIESLRAQVRAIETLNDLLEVVAHFHVIGISVLWGGFVDQDSKNSSRYLLTFWQGGLSLPDRDYYIGESSEQIRVRKEYKKYIRKLLLLTGLSNTQVKIYEKAIIRIEALLAHASMRKEDTRDPEKTYHKISISQLKRIAPTVNWQNYLAKTHVRDVDVFNVGQPDFFKEISRLLKSVPIDEWKLYLEWHLINGSAGLLSDPFVKENFDFYGKVLTGAKKIRDLWRRALSTTGSVVGEALGQLYVREYFPSSSKRVIDELVSDLFKVYGERIKNLDWMSNATRKKAVAKLHSMKRKIAYPSKWKGYKGLRILPNDFFGNILRSSEFEHKREIKKLGHTVDRSEWFMSPQTVNAYCSFNMNEIVFPAAILQWPFFDPSADSSINYAGIGSVIGHEMTHGFDDQGSKFDGKGNMKNWWKESDRKHFDKKGQLLLEQYGRYEVEGGLKVNGDLTLGENIADLGGLVIAWDAYQKHLKKEGRKIIGGFTPEERFFLGFAQQERELRRPESVRTQILTDPHSPAEFRINGPFANFEPFYQFYNLKKTDKLYLEQKKRSEIW